MPQFAVTVEFEPGDPNIALVRPLHREYLVALRDQGNLVISGPFTEGDGGLIVFEAASREDIDTLLRNDPFYKAGVYRSWAVRAWNPVFVNRDLLPEG